MSDEDVKRPVAEEVVELELVEWKMDVPKEAKEVIDALAKVTLFLKEKKPIAEIGVLLPDFVAAADKFNQVVPAFKSDHNDETAAYLLKQILGALKGEKVE